MISISIGIYGSHDEPRAEVLTIDTGERFIVFRFSPDASLNLNGFDSQAVAHARAIAACLTTAADELAAALADRPAAVVETTPARAFVPDDEVVF